MSDRDPFRELETLFDQFATVGTGLSGDVRLDVVDAGEAFEVRADLPGFPPEATDVRVEDDQRLSIDAERDVTSESGDGDFLTRERHRESVHREVTLPAPVDAEATEASYDEGVLTVRLPKRTGDDEGTQIDVN